ncbi:hypothetical protein [Thiomicrorhabdus sp.]|uniref:hypothetical protein n=1 Tax=Thiomicrorhabdus sp. TaxID=2039724 RepID=UPI0029C8874A|nr:hypothetical protein [Thiomicrorhabdus sp.]
MDIELLGVKHKDGKSFQVAPGLQMHVSLKNKKSWRLRYVDLNGKAENPKIGDFPVMTFHHVSLP